MDDPRLIKLEWTTLQCQRPRAAGCNARLGEHGKTVPLPLARVTAEDGTVGFGFARLDPASGSALLGQLLSALFLDGRNGRIGVTELGRALEYPLWDLVAKRAQLPVYRMAAQAVEATLPETLPFRVRCYDTSLYFDDLHLAEESDAVALLVSEAQEGVARGHRAFKIKVGRGARHLPLEAGTRRDIAIIRAVLQAVGAEAPLMIDANNGWNLNLAKRVLEETVDYSLYWLEEAFHEDPVLYSDLKAWMQRHGLATLIADGEGNADPRLLDWAREGYVDVIQYDIFGHGLTRWLATGQQLDGWKVRSAPHHYGTLFGNFASCHLAGAIREFTFVEWDEASVSGLDASAYAIKEGEVVVPETPGFGLELEADVFAARLEADGFVLASK